MSLEKKRAWGGYFWSREVDEQAVRGSVSGERNEVWFNSTACQIVARKDSAQQHCCALEAHQLRRAGDGHRTGVSHQHLALRVRYSRRGKVIPPDIRQCNSTAQGQGTSSTMQQALTTTHVQERRKRQSGMLLGWPGGWILRIVAGLAQKQSLILPVDQWDAKGKWEISTMEGNSFQ